MINSFYRLFFSVVVSEWRIASLAIWKKTAYVIKVHNILKKKNHYLTTTPTKKKRMEYAQPINMLKRPKYKLQIAEMNESNATTFAAERTSYVIIHQIAIDVFMVWCNISSILVYLLEYVWKWGLSKQFCKSCKTFFTRSNDIYLFVVPFNVTERFPFIIKHISMNMCVCVYSGQLHFEMENFRF